MAMVGIPYAPVGHGERLLSLHSSRRSSPWWRVRCSSVDVQGENSSGTVVKRKRRLFDTRRTIGSVSRSRKWKDMTERLESMHRPVELLEDGEWSPAEFWDLVVFLNMNQRFDDSLEVFEWWRKRPKYRGKEEHFIRFLIMSGKAGRPDTAKVIFDGMEASGITPTLYSFTALIQSYADNGAPEQAEAMVNEMLHRGLKPSVVTYAVMIRGYGRQGLYDEMAKVFNTMKTVHCQPDFFVYKNLIEAYSRGGLVGRMEKAFKAMLMDGWRADTETLSMVGQGYASVGMIKEMEQIQAYFKRVKRFPDEETVRSMALAYIRQSQFYQMGEFAKSLGLKNSTMGNLLWNMVLLASAANFSMKTLQREALSMSESNFKPDLTTFNVRALAFSRMQMFWDLHVLVQHIHSVHLKPDLVTCGAVVDAYVVGRLVEKLPEALDELQVLETVPDVRTDPLVLEAFGRGKFQVFCEDFMSGKRSSRVTYSTLTTCYFEMLREKRESKRKWRGGLQESDVWQRDSGF